MQVWLNGKFHSDSALVGAASAGLMLGLGVFTTIGVWRRRPFALDRHLARLRRDAARAEVDLNIDDETLESASLQLIENHFAHAFAASDKAASDAVSSDGMARITITQRGDGRWSHEQGSDVCILFSAYEPNRYEPGRSANEKPMSRFPQREDKAARLVEGERGMSTHATLISEASAISAESRLAPALEGCARLTLSPYRVEARRPLGGVKSTSYGDPYLAWREARARSFDEAVLLNSDGALCEGARSSVFWARGGELRTPALSCGALPGIAREIVLEWAHEDAIAVRESVFAPGELDEADEIFITSAAQGPRAVALWHHDGDSRTLAAPGHLTAHFLRRWSQAVSS